MTYPPLRSNRVLTLHGWTDTKPAENMFIRFDMCDGWSSAFWECDRRILRPDVDYHIAVIIDGGPKVISFVVDGVLCDGGEDRPFGWGRFNPTFKDINGADKLQIAPSLHGRLKRLRIHDRYLRTSKTIGNFKAGWWFMNEERLELLDFI